MSTGTPERAGGTKNPKARGTNPDQTRRSAIVVQWDLARLDPEQNIEQATQLLKDADPRPGDIVVLPELWPTGYGKRHELEYLVVEKSALWNAFMTDLAQMFRINLVGGSVPAFQGERLVNRLVLYSPAGEHVGSYDKIHLFPPMHEEDLFKPGSHADPIEPGSMPFTIGPVVCYDLRFPELFRLLASKGANLFVLPSEFPDPKEDLWHVFLAARAAENQAYVVASNRTGASGSFTFFGSSAVYDPEGRCMGRLGREPGHLSVPLDFALVEATRQRLKVLQHMRLVSTINVD